jgi:hypothetical protein
MRAAHLADRLPAMKVVTLKVVTMKVVTMVVTTATYSKTNHDELGNGFGLVRCGILVSVMEFAWQEVGFRRCN